MTQASLLSEPQFVSLLSKLPGCLLASTRAQRFRVGDAVAIKNPAISDGVNVCREMDSDITTPPAFPLRVLYSFQPLCCGIRLPDKSAIDKLWCREICCIDIRFSLQRTRW